MAARSSTPLVTVALPVRNGAATLGPVVESVLAQDHADLELVVSDNASTDETARLCREYARADRRVVYRRHARDIGLLNNFRSAASVARGRYVRWLGDDDLLAPDYLSRTLEAFARDERRVLVTTQVRYVDGDDVVLRTDHDPSGLASTEPVERFAAMLRLLTSGFAVVDPLYGLVRRDLAVLPRRNLLREDEVYAARLALAGPWGHVAAPLAHRHRTEVPTTGLVRLLGVPRWHRHVPDLLQVRELLHWVDRAGLDPAQRRRARAEVARMYARRKRNHALRGVRKAQRLAGRT